jgi:hypothetical protein
MLDHRPITGSRFAPVIDVFKVERPGKASLRLVSIQPSQIRLAILAAVMSWSSLKVSIVANPAWWFGNASLKRPKGVQDAVFAMPEQETVQSSDFWAESRHSFPGIQTN